MCFQWKNKLNKKDVQEIILELDKKESIFNDKSYLDTLSFPKKIVGRKKKAEEILQFLVGYKRGYLVPLVSIYGRSGSGKSIVTRFVCKNLEDVSSIFVNLRKAKTIFGSAKLILDELGQNSIKSANGLNEAIEKIGFSIKAKLDSEGKKVFVLVLDEIDVLFYDIRGKPSDFLYKLLVIEEKLRENNYLMCIITISNHLLGNYNIDDRVKSRVGSSEVCFEPYSKDEVLKILQEVSKKAFIQKPDKRVLQKCANLSSSEHGDARRAINLLRRAAEIAASNSEIIGESHVDVAESELSKRNAKKFFLSASHHMQLVFLAIAKLSFLIDVSWHATSTLYKQYCRFLKEDEKSLSYRRISDLLSELEQAGFVISRTESKGRHGYGKQYRMTYPPEPILQTDPEKFKEYKGIKKEYYDLTHDPKYKGSFHLKWERFYNEKKWRWYVGRE